MSTAHAVAQAVHHESLLRFRESYLGRDAGKAHRAGRTGARSALGTAYHYEVGLGLSHSCCDGSHSALGHELHADSRTGIDVSQVEDELCKVFYGVDVVVGWRRYERYAGYGVARACYHLVHLETWQLASLTGLGTLRHLDLYLLGIDKILRRHSEAATCHLLGLRREADTIHLGVEPLLVLAALAGV